MKIYLFLVVFVSGTFSLEKPEPFDFVEDALGKYLNQSVDPCDDFYRHACSFDSPEGLVDDAFKGFSAYIEESQKNLFFNKLSVMNDYDSEKFGEAVTILSDIPTMLDFYTDILESSCTQNIEFSGELIEMLVDISQHAFNFSYAGYLKTNGRLMKNGDQESQCQKLSDFVKENLQKAFSKLNSVTKESVYSLRGYTKMMKGVLITITAILDFDVREGIHETGRMVNAVLKFEEELIRSTPWLKNETVRTEFEEIVKELDMYDNYGQDFQNYTDQLISIEDKYTKCKNKMRKIDFGNLFCYIWTASVTFDNSAVQRFFMHDNAINGHPLIWFGFPNYYHTQFGKEMASKLGYTGFTVGHEIGHTYFDSNHGLTLPAFPQKLRECVQNQYNATCKEYKEESCSTEDKQMEDNGADIFGLQAAYFLLEEHYGEAIEETIDRLGITNEQLFFYSFAFQFCQRAPSTGDKLGSHAANNIRINAVVQNPGFQNAFNCPDDSRMMKSATEMCIMYGKDAPESRKRRKFQRTIKRKSYT